MSLLCTPVRWIRVNDIDISLVSVLTGSTQREYGKDVTLGLQILENSGEIARKIK